MFKTEPVEGIGISRKGDRSKGKGGMNRTVGYLSKVVLDYKNQGRGGYRKGK